MRLNLNLANRPFTNHRLFWIVITLALIGGIGCALWLKSEKDAAVRATADCEKNIARTLDEFNKRKQEEERKRLEEQSIALTPDEKKKLAAARLVISQKSFSMDRVLTDLEGYVPEDTRIVGIKIGTVTTNADQKSATVEVSALGKTAGQLTAMMEKLEKSAGTFQVDQANQGQTSDTGEIPFAITMTYVLRSKAGE
ncbi:MAG TPA: hypothetical protein VFV34_11950 [Blastocatellia bacterium]|nr:hypothetical protein [Blastocatellia bacterium]